MEMAGGTYLSDVHRLIKFRGEIHFFSQLSVLILKLHILVQLGPAEETCCHVLFLFMNIQ